MNKITEQLKEWDKEPNAQVHLFNTWKAMTRTMFWNSPAIQVYDVVDECLAEASNEQYWYEKIAEKSAREVPRIERKIVMVKGKARKLIDANLKITEVAERYGLKVKGNKCVCPFHADKDPSLSFSNEKNVFHCFGCGAKGDIVEFYRLMEERNDRRI